jgi:hypothetical protein
MGLADAAARNSATRKPNLGTKIEAGNRPDSGPMPTLQEPTLSAWQTLRRSRQGLGLTLLIAAWGGLVVILCLLMFAYEFKHDLVDSERLVTHWPSDTQITTSPGRPTLLLFLHPKCPCSRASLAEMERIWVLENEQSKDTPQLVVVATVPPDEPNDWLTTGTVEQSRRLAGAEFVVDPGGREAQRFGATTSGTVMWFDAAGNCLYAGGLTSGRGHEGGNVGRDCLEQLMRGEAPTATGLPAFGCRLCLPDSA